MNFQIFAIFIALRQSSIADVWNVISGILPSLTVCTFAFHCGAHHLSPSPQAIYPTLVILFVAMDQQNEGSVLQIATQDAGTHRSVLTNISTPSHASQQNDSEQVTSAMGMNDDFPEEVATEARAGCSEAGASGVARDE